MLITYFLLGVALARAHSDYGISFRAQNFEKTVQNIDILKHQRTKRLVTGYFTPQNNPTHQTWRNMNITRNNTFTVPKMTTFMQNGTQPSNNNGRLIYPGQPGYVVPPNNTSGLTNITPHPFRAMTNVSTQNYVNPGRNYNINVTRPGYSNYSNIYVMPVNKNNNTLNPVTPGYMPYPGYNTGYPGYPAPNSVYPAPNTGFPSSNNGYPAPSVYPRPNSGYPIQNTSYTRPIPSYPIPNTSYPIPNTSYPIPNTGYQKPNNFYPASNNGYTLPNNGYTAPNNGYTAPNNGYTAPNNGYTAPNNGYTAQNNGYTAPNNGYTAQNNGYTAPNNGYTAPNNGYTAPNNGYTAPNNGYTAPNNGYTAPNNGYTAPNNGYTAPNNGYTAPNNGYTAPNNGYAAPNNGYTAPNNGYTAPNTGFNNTASLANCKCSFPRANSTITKEERTMDACMISCNNCPSGMKMSSIGICVKDEDNDY